MAKARNRRLSGISTFDYQDRFDKLAKDIRRITRIGTDAKRCSDRIDFSQAANRALGKAEQQIACAADARERVRASDALAASAAVAQMRADFKKLDRAVAKLDGVAKRCGRPK